MLSILNTQAHNISLHNILMGKIRQKEKIVPWFIKSLWIWFTTLIWLCVACTRCSDCDAFKLHFFLDCCCVLFVYLCHWILTHYRMMIRSDEDLVYFHALGIGCVCKNEERPLFLFISWFVCRCYNIYSKFVAVHADNLCEQMSSCENNMGPIEWIDLLHIRLFKNTICINFTKISCCWCNLCLSLRCIVYLQKGFEKKCPGNKYYKCKKVAECRANNMNKKKREKSTNWLWKM